MTEDPSDGLITRMRQLQSEGLDSSKAFGIASLEQRIRLWPPKWGDDLHIILYGDFRVPDAALIYASLGITILPGKAENIKMAGALTAVNAVVKIESKTVASLAEASRRINVLLGTYTLHSWGNGSSGWWSYVTHGSSGGLLTELTPVEAADRSIKSIHGLSQPIRKQIEAALFWVREPRNPILLGHRLDTLRIYSAYWNAFECLVEAVNITKPRPSKSKSAKQVQLDTFLRERDGRLSLADLEGAYRSLVDPGFREKAKHALQVCFGADGARYTAECFTLKEKSERLYDIRNAINHGTIDTENPIEIIRVEARQRLLWMIVWRMFARFIPFPSPVDAAETKSEG